METRNNFTVDHKVDLLKYLIRTSHTWTDADLAAFFTHVQNTFGGFKGTKWEDQDLETKLRKEERLWLAECAGSRPRRRGHEKGSYYDNAMTTWKEIWNELLIKDWQNEVDCGRTYDQVPASLRDKLVFPTRPSASTTSSKSPSGTPQAPLMTAADSQKPPDVVLEYDEDKLKTIIDNAVQEALRRGDKDTALAVQTVYRDSQEIWELRYLLEQIFKQTANAEQTSRFHQYIRAAKRKVKLQKAQQQADKVRQQGDRRAHKFAPIANMGKGSNSVAPIEAKRPDHAPAPAVQQKLEPLSPADAGPSQWPAAEIDENDAGMVDTVHADTPDAQLAAEERSAEQQATRTAKANGSSASAETAVTSDSGYDTTDKQPHRDPLVTKILGNLQHEPSVKRLLRYDRALPTSANIKQLRKRESALEAIKDIITAHPAAKTDLTVLAKRLQERSARETAADGEQATAGAEHSGDEGSDHGLEEQEAEDVTPQTRRSLRPRRSIGEESSEQVSSERRRTHKWPCPMAQEAGCDQWFSSSGHAIRHANIHSGVKDYNCPECDKAFARKDNMMEHFRGVHKNRVSSKKRGRRSSVLSDREVGEDADRIAAERAAKRQKNSEKAFRNARAARDSSVESAGTTDSSLTDLTSSAEDRRPPAAGSSGNGTMTQLTHALEVSANTAHENLDHAVKATAVDLAKDPATLLARLEAKMDALLTRQNTAPAHSSSSGTSTPNGTHTQPGAEHAIWSSAMSLLNIATSLDHNALDGQSPELVQFVARLTKTAAEAVIRASDSAKQLALTAKSVSEMLEDYDGFDEQISPIPKSPIRESH
ncbi:hypothetical protein CKM354_000692700 [Cercospora kikuchii]|uniref:C2H2-type domain-containing protein n=1 Tax=Cercospora kikuchii TaxID=84275 RepID=A0A9P3FIR5_9PEZI|nr:uncharacterized protein CKM354_000692700 [Cercospora kikuchii]GIZ43710.1 hypothetical protein CKM354_000692700 [Cercospora kikuchii]